MRKIRVLLAVAAVTAGLLTVPAAALAVTPCEVTGYSDSCGAYPYDGTIVNANGSNTYVQQDGFGCPGACTSQVLTVNGPGDWNVEANDAAGNTSIWTYPSDAELFNNWTGAGWCGGANPQCSGGLENTPLASLTYLHSNVCFTMPDNAQTITEAAWDIWQGSYTSDVMIWESNANRGTGGAAVLGHAVFYGQSFTLLGYDQGDELIWSLDGPGGEGTYANSPGECVRAHIKAMLGWLHSHDRAGTSTPFLPNAPVISAIDFGWELGSTGGVPEDFAVTSYGITAGIVPGA